jgi:methylmalonyl-CoA mutase N-terminal domain/subunit
VYAHPEAVKRRGNAPRTKRFAVFTPITAVGKKGARRLFPAQLNRLAEFHAGNAKAAPNALERLKRAVIENGNFFAELVNTVRVCSLEQITRALFEAGGEYRRRL